MIFLPRLVGPTLFVVLWNIHHVSAQCGSLVTYRQHAVLLQSAPQCLRESCSNGPNNSISSPCPSSSPCSAYWKMFVDKFDQKHSWCSDCSSDAACRISGWPVLNATALCESTPNQLLFGDEGCCSQGEQPMQLAEWTGTLCNGSEWRQQFDNCGGMACLDWREWIMPWNWTVQNNLVSPDQQNCRPPSEYLAIYVGEHFAWLVATFAIGFLRLWIAKHEEANNRSVFRYLLLSVGRKVKFTQHSKDVWKEKKFLLDGEHLRPPITDNLKWGFPIIMGIFLAGLQLSFNFLVAHVIKTAPGYDGVPLHLLALLFCCRPRLSWLSCLLALVSKDRLQKIFNFKPNGDGLWAAKLVLSSVAVSSAVTEAIMQLLGAYFLGTTANVGRQRGFYKVHRLRPKLWGRNARRMYLGALYWVMLCIPLLIVWFLVALFYSTIYHAISGWRRRIFNFLKRKKDVIPDIVKRPAQKLRSLINPDTELFDDQPFRGHYAPDQPLRPSSTTVEDLDQPMRHQKTQYEGAGGMLSTDPDQPMRVERTVGGSRYLQLHHSEPFDQPFMISQATLFDQHTIQRSDIPSPPTVQRRTANGQQYGAIALSEDNSPYAATGSYYSPSSIQRRTPSGSQYNSLAQTDYHSPRTEAGTYMHSPLSVQRRTASGGQYESLTRTDEDAIESDPFGDRAFPVSNPSNLRHEVARDDIIPSNRSDVNDLLLVSASTAVGTTHATSTSENSSAHKRSDYKEELAFRERGREKWIILAGAFFGMLAYAAQWVFWDGFVKASGDRFCPPNYWKVNGIWWGGSAVYVGAPLMAY